MHKKIVRTLIAGLFAACAPAMADLSAQVHFDIAAQQLSVALLKYSEQSGVQITSPGDLIKGKMSTRVVGKLGAKDGLERLLQGTDLAYEVIDANTVLIRASDRKSRSPATSAAGQGGGAGAARSLVRIAAADGATAGGADAAAQSQDEPQESSDTRGIPEILVEGSRSLNIDIERSEDGPQPYVVFSREEIERSQAQDLDDFLRSRLPMNAMAGSISQNLGESAAYSSINLRGLGAHQTLILIDGRRVPGVTLYGNPQQPDINGIPLSAVERIEVLPSTAGGIYGGNATGGVINIVLRRNYQGLEARVNYANTFDTDTGSLRLEASTGFTLEDGRTQVMMMVSRSEANNLTVGDRNFAQRAIALQWENDRDVSAWTSATTPPLGATPNIRSASGAVLVLDDEYGGTSLGFNTTHIPLGYAGPDSDNGAALVANAGRYNLDLPNDVNGLGRGLISAPTVESLALNVRREFGQRLEGFIDFSHLRRRGSSFIAPVPSFVTLPADAPNNPFTEAINVRFPTPGLSGEARSDSRTLRATAGLIARLPRQWTGEIDYGWSRSRYGIETSASVLDSGATSSGTGALYTGLPSPDGRPALNVLQEPNTYPLDFTPYLLPMPNYFIGPFDTILHDVTLRLSGPTVQLPGGPLTLAALLEYRDEELQDAFYELLLSSQDKLYSFYPSRSQEVETAYVEARAPLISHRNARSWARELELQVSLRRDEYTSHAVTPASASPATREGPFPDFSYTIGRQRSTDYTLGLRYWPVADLVLRASFGTGFLAPSVNQIVPTIDPQNTNSRGLDPRRGNTSMYAGTPYTYISGGNPNLKLEDSQSWSAGLIFTPRFLPDLRLSVDYTRIEKTDEIQNPSFIFLVNNESLFPDRIVRGEKLPGDPEEWAGPIIQLDMSPINVAGTKVEAYDFQVDYTLRTARMGEFRWSAVATWQTHYQNQTTPDSPVVEYVGFNGRPLKWRGNMGLSWRQGGLGVDWNAQYYHSYLIYSALALPLTDAQQASREAAIRSQGSDTIPSQIYHDLVASYEFDGTGARAGGWLANTEISFGIRNIFNTSPPILASPYITAGYSPYGDPRLRRYSLSIRKNFGR